MGRRNAMQIDWNTAEVMAKSQGLKGCQLAALIHLSQSSLSAIENGNSLPSAQTIVKLMMLEGLDIFWLLGVSPQ